MMARGLNARQRQFAQEFIVDLNASAAARRAGYSVKTAGSIGFDLLKKPEIEALIAEGMRARQSRTEVTQDRVVKELARIAFGDPRAVMTWGPDGVKLKDSTTLNDDVAALVAEISETVTEHGGTLRIKTNDKLRALELLGKHVGAFKGAPGEDDDELPVSIVVEMVDARRRRGEHDDA